MQHNQFEWLDRRLELLSTAYGLATEDKNPDNHKENIEMMERCKIAISALTKVKLLTIKP